MPVSSTIGTASQFETTLPSLLRHPLLGTRARFRRWIYTRVKRVPGPVTIHRSKIYIVPTRFGFVFGILVFMMLMGAMNYSNSLAFVMTFMLVGLGLVCMHHTHRNILNLRIRRGHQAPVFMGQDAVFDIVVENPTEQPRYTLNVHCPQDDATDEALSEPLDVMAGSETSATFRLPTTRRGTLAAPRFGLNTQFPLFLFHAWTWMELDMFCMVYPKPAESTLIPPPASGGSQGKPDRVGGKEDFFGLRPYHAGDTPHSIHWKSMPKTGELMVKQFADPIQQEIWLEWDALEGMAAEGRLSQLCRWVLDTHRDGHRFGLRLPSESIAPDSGETHKHRCLEALALFEP